MIDKHTNNQHALAAAKVLHEWRNYLRDNIDVLNKDEIKVLSHVAGAIVDVQEAVKGAR